MPLYGNELSRETNPFEANLGRVVKLEKGEFVGRAALQAVQQAGPVRKLIGLQMVDNAIPRAGYEVRADGDAVGHVTSGTLSPTLGTQDRDGHGPGRVGRHRQRVRGRRPRPPVSGRAGKVAVLPAPARLSRRGQLDGPEEDRAADVLSRRPALLEGA